MTTRAELENMSLGGVIKQASLKGISEDDLDNALAGEDSKADIVDWILDNSPEKAGYSDMISKRASIGNLDSKMLKVEYAVRGVVVGKSVEMKKRLADGEALPFKELIPCNIGNPHAVKQKPITFYRQVAACCMNPGQIEGSTLPADVISRAKEYLAATGGNGLGSYTDSIGLLTVRQQIAEFIEKRDGFPCDPSNLELTTGASEGVKRCIQALIKTTQDGVLIPCPQYPLYSAAITMFGGQIVYYNLDEDKNWGVTREELDRAYGEAQAKGINIRAFAVINPGNPSGSVLAKEEVEMMVTFAKDKEIVILADEVYQENVYTPDKKFHSFKKIRSELQLKDPACKDVQLVSFHSTSKDACTVHKDGSNFVKL
jgi:alanine transaminase